MSTKIPWCDETLNVTTGCTPIGVGCQHCYAKTMFKRLASMKNMKKYYGRTFDQVQCHDDAVYEPHGWSAPRSVFVNSMSDLFHPDVPFEFVHKVWATMTVRSQHTYILLTKRPERMRHFLWWLHEQHVKDFGSKYNEIPSLRIPAPNIVGGVSASTQYEANELISQLRLCPLDRRFLSAEPLVEELDLYCGGFSLIEKLVSPGGRVYAKLDGVIIGGESGQGARRMRASWVRRVRDDCKAAGVKFYFKQWGDGAGPDAYDDLNGVCATMQAAHHGRMLDGRTHDDLCWEVRA